MPIENKLKRSLLVLRLGVFIVMFVWTIDKFIDPEHTTRVWQHFYLAPGFGASVSYLIGAVQLMIVLAFAAGYKKRFSYGAVLLLHTVSTLASMGMYFKWKLLFFAAWPMLATCFVLFYLREHDTMWSLD